MVTNVKTVTKSSRYVRNDTTYLDSVISVQSETITGYRGKRLPGALNNCHHTKSRIFPARLNVVSPGAYEHNLRGEAPVSLSEYSVGLVERFTPSVGYSINASDSVELANQLAGDIAPSVLVPNMILELPETLNLWQALKSPLLKAVSLQGNTLRGRLRHGSNALLAQQFGLFPLIGDLCKLLTSTRSVHSEMKRISAIPSTWSKTSKGLSPRDAVASIAHASSGQGFTVSTRVDSVNVSARLHYEQKKLRQLPDDQMASALGRALYGFSRPYSVLYEATPFSFVADWFFPIGEYLNALSAGELHGSLAYRNVCYTVKSSLSWSATALWESAPRFALCSGISSVFDRGIGFPSRQPLLNELGIPNLKQSILGAALVLQR